jgi:SEC-C motif
MQLNSRAKAGRNDSCPCGSGKKYKHCCLMVEHAVDDSPWRQQRDASGRLTEELLNFAFRKFAGAIHAAWLDFNQDESPVPFEDDEAERQIFFPYFLFDWDPDRPRHRRGRQPREGIVARSFMLQGGSRLEELELLILKQATTQPVSFYEVVQCDPGRRMVLRDVLVGGETEVVERTASKVFRPGDLGYGQLCKLPEVTVLGRMAPLRMLPARKVEVVGLRASLRKKIAKQNRELAAADLIRYGEEIRSVYLNVRDAMRRPPQFTNTDGDPFLFHTLTFRSGSAHAAFEALAPLAWGVSKKELLEQAELDQDGALRSVQIPWIKKGNRKFPTWENTILGHITVSERSLVAEVNSQKRATKLRQEVERSLGILAVHESTVVKTPEEMLTEREPREDPHGAASKAESSGSLLDPKMRAQAEAEFQREVDTWIYQKIPALGGLTPFEAVVNPDGKELVEALLLDWERKNEEPAGPDFLRPDVNAIRRLLKLNTSVH